MLNSEIAKAPDFYNQPWGTTLSFTMNVGQMGLYLLNGRSLWGLWRSGSGLGNYLLAGTDTRSQFAMDDNGVVTITIETNSAMTALIMN